VLISGAAARWRVACQIAKAMDCNGDRFAGTDEKCAYLSDVLASTTPSTTAPPAS